MWRLGVDDAFDLVGVLLHRLQQAEAKDRQGAPRRGNRRIASRRLARLIAKGKPRCMKALVDLIVGKLGHG